jgi:sugar/nucleoside kinase (ribokinase family)
MKKVLAMGNALVDIVIPIESDDILAALGLPKGSMQLVDWERSKAVQEAFKNHKSTLSAGGSAANTIHSLGKLGVPSGYLGVVGEDELGGFFVKDMINAGVDPHMIHSNQPTGRAVALISPDSERTFATFLGAAIELSAEHLSPSPNPTTSGIQYPASSIFSKYNFFHIEGYLVQNHALIETAVKMAKAAGLTVSIDLASYNVVEANIDFLHHIIENYVDIVFANEEEAKAFTGKDPHEALHEIGGKCEIAVVKTGSQGSMIKKGADLHNIGVIAVSPIDTTGAGDLYAAGFLYGLANDKPLPECGRIGALLAGNVIEFMGSKMPAVRWLEILGQL